MRFGGIKPKDQSSVKEESTAVDIRDCIEISQANPNIDLGDIYVGEGFVNKSFKYKFIFTDPNASQIYSSFAVDL